MESDAVSAEKKEKKPREPTVLVREPGKSLLPFTRVQKIIKADKEIALVAKDATFLISLATEEFIRRLAESAHRIADSERRATIQHKDINTVVRRADEFAFLEGAHRIQYVASTKTLEEIMAFFTQETQNALNEKKRRPKETPGDDTNKSRSTLLDHFVKQPAEEDDGDVIMDDNDAVSVRDGESYETQQDED